ncbi:MAG: N-6 DNA methylase [Mycoplasmatales bacterium]|nr:N-6 DNA methylase [Mycoplasmatales bacterium]
MHIVIGILFLKNMSDKYDNAMQKMQEDYGDKWELFKEETTILSTKYNCSFVIPEKASWKYISEYASSLEIGEVLDQAFYAIEEKNIELKGLFDKDYNRQELDQSKLGKVVSEFSNIDMEKYEEDIIGRTYEYFLGNFFMKQGQKGGEFYTPKSIVKLIVDLIEPEKGKIYDPACGTGGMFVQARQHIIDMGKNPDDLVVYGQEYQNKTWKLAKINLLLQGFHAKTIKLGTESADTFSNDQHKGEKFDFILANPPFNIKQWGQEQLVEDPRWKWGIPPKGNANYAWLSHMIDKLNKNGRAGVVLANGSLSTASKGEKEIRINLLKENKVDAIIALPSSLFYTTGIPASIWIFNNNKTNEDVLMINADQLGKMETKKLRILQNEDIKSIVELYKKHEKNEVISKVGFAQTTSLKEIEENDWSLVPGRYVGYEEEIIDKEEVKKEIKELSKELKELFKEFNEMLPKVEESIEKALKLNEE